MAYPVNYWLFKLSSFTSHFSLDNTKHTLEEAKTTWKTHLMKNIWLHSIFKDFWNPKKRQITRKQRMEGSRENPGKEDDDVGRCLVPSSRILQTSRADESQERTKTSPTLPSQTSSMSKIWSEEFQDIRKKCMHDITF